MDLYDQLNKPPANDEKPVPTPETQEGHGVGAAVGTIIIILLLALGAFYFWGARLNEMEDNAPPYILGNESTSGGSDADAGLPAQSSSDDPDDIYADINAMNMQQLESANQNSSF